VLNWKNGFTILLVLAAIAVFYFSFTNKFFHGGDRAQWMKEHGTVATRHEDLDKFCLDCHAKSGQTKENFCNKCHQQNNIELIK